MDAKTRRLDHLAATQVIDDTEVAHCWQLVRDGIRTCKLGTANLPKVIALLRAGLGYGADEWSIDIEPPHSDRAMISLLDDERTCAAPALIAELERLAEREAESA
ncbi:MAG TPA: hypothetical protein PKD61_02385 [Polyangiaceae bacterium]|nr:hypothetical protein [Polyangiaceae bacterium]